MKEKEVKLVIQNAEGGKAFCAGGDIRSITDAGRNGDIFPGCNFFNEIQVKLRSSHASSTVSIYHRRYHYGRRGRSIRSRNFQSCHGENLIRNARNRYWTLS